MKDLLLGKCKGAAASPQQIARPNEHDIEIAPRNVYSGGPAIVLAPEAGKSSRSSAVAVPVATVVR